MSYKSRNHYHKKKIAFSARYFLCLSAFLRLMRKWVKRMKQNLVACVVFTQLKASTLTFTFSNSLGCRWDKISLRIAYKRLKGIKLSFPVLDIFVSLKT